MSGKMTREEARAHADAKRARADALITGALDQLTNPQVWAGYLGRGASLGRYSIRNQLLIGMQAPDASDVAGYVEWQDRGRQVRKGETGIMIWAPVTRADEDSDEGARKMCGVRVASVFDIAQTDPIEGRPFKPAPGKPARDLDEIRGVIAAIAGDNAPAILAALDRAGDLVHA